MKIFITRNNYSGISSIHRFEIYRKYIIPTFLLNCTEFRTKTLVSYCYETRSHLRWFFMGPSGLEPATNRCQVNPSTGCNSVYCVHLVSEKWGDLSIESILSIDSTVFAPITQRGRLALLKEQTQSKLILLNEHNLITAQYGHD